MRAERGLGRKAKSARAYQTNQDAKPGNMGACFSALSLIDLRPTPHEGVALPTSSGSKPPPSSSTTPLSSPSATSSVTPMREQPEISPVESGLLGKGSRISLGHNM